jgi:hypothetical protein
LSMSNFSREDLEIWCPGFQPASHLETAVHTSSEPARTLRDALLNRMD